MPLFSEYSQEQHRLRFSLAMLLAGLAKQSFLQKFSPDICDEVDAQLKYDHSGNSWNSSSNGTMRGATIDGYFNFFTLSTPSLPLPPVIRLSSTT